MQPSAASPTHRDGADGPPRDSGRASQWFADAVAEGLSASPRRLPTEFFYDALGSALFDAIGQLPWYPITRAESALLRAHASVIAELAGQPSTIIELGPGNGSKLATLLRAFTNPSALDVHLVDVSQSALDAALQALEFRTQAAGAVVVKQHLRTYEAGAREALAERGPDGRALTVFLGSNIGNFDRGAADRLLRELREGHRPGDRLLLGADLVKPESEMLLAYDDPLGVTAAFNRNLLVRVNRELGANFAIESFLHRAVWNAAEARMEAYLVSTTRQRVRIPASNVDIVFEPGDAIWTESSHKYTPEGVAAMLARAGFGVLHQWIGDGFALTLGEAA